MSPNEVQILIVDDEPDCADQLVEFMRRRGISARGVYSVAEALEAIAADPGIGFVVSDIRMPGLTGFALIDRVRELLSREGHKKYPDFIIMTGHAGQVEAEVAAAYGVIGFLTKPFDPYDLERLIREKVSDLAKPAKSPDLLHEAS